MRFEEDVGQVWEEEIGQQCDLKEKMADFKAKDGRNRLNDKL